MILGDSFRWLWGVESTTVFDCLLLIGFFAGGLLESWLYARFLRQEMDLGSN
jgi:hypothetical protein